MRFITEEDLRDQYRKEPFTDYKIEPGTRITPGARQFLADRGILMFENGCWENGGGTKEKAAAPEAEKKKSCNKKLLRRIKTMEAMMMMTAEELLTRDVLLAQNLMELGKNLADTKKVMESEAGAGSICCKGCTGISEADFDKSLEDCFDITSFHIQLAKGKEIVLLHRLRCELRELEAEAQELKEEQVGQRINQIINTLSQWICLTVGGEKCQKQA